MNNDFVKGVFAAITLLIGVGVGRIQSNAVVEANAQRVTDLQELNRVCQRAMEDFSTRNMHLHNVAEHGQQMREKAELEAAALRAERNADVQKFMETWARTNLAQAQTGETDAP